ncbi:MAG: hypothetical protein GXO64_01345 [Candidatus Micrarchaeota archaeon]|nr:hypothetical protein [Candidatus Micrarchaeota archaeon]
MKKSTTLAILLPFLFSLLYVSDANKEENAKPITRQIKKKSFVDEYINPFLESGALDTIPISPKLAENFWKMVYNKGEKTSDDGRDTLSWNGFRIESNDSITFCVYKKNGTKIGQITVEEEGNKTVILNDFFCDGKFTYDEGDNVTINGMPLELYNEEDRRYAENLLKVLIGDYANSVLFSPSSSFLTAMDRQIKTKMFNTAHEAVLDYRKMRGIGGDVERDDGSYGKKRGYDHNLHDTKELMPENQRYKKKSRR